ncbi:MAG: class I SAM-dependent methyltransferase [Planctomycetota bacterium]
MHHVLNAKPIGWWGKDDFYKTGEADAHRFVDSFFDAHGISTRRRVCLEIGCGAGRVTGALAKRFGRVIALDVSDDMLDVAREHVDADNVTFVRGNGVNLDVIDDGSVSFVFSTMVFQHIPDVEVQYELLREVGRVLRPNGWYFIHLYADKAGYERKKTAWEKRAAGQVLLGWSDAALPELKDDNYKTSMCTVVDDAKVYEVLKESDLKITYEDGKQSSTWIIGGQKK